jgi:hypothetical protein
MGLNNSLKIREFLSFGENDFYFVQLIKRRKDNPEMLKDVKVIRSYYINSFDDYDKLIPKIIETCDNENCRAYIRLNKRNYAKLALKLISETAQLASNSNDLRSLPNLFDSVAGQFSSDPDKKWIVDVDWKDLENINEFIIDGDIFNIVNGIPEIVHLFSTLNDLQVGANKDPLLELIKTKNGFHVVTRPFNLHLFSKTFPNLQVHKDNMSIIYCP